MKQQSLWTTISAICLIVGGGLTLESWLPYHGTLADARGLLSPFVVVAGGVLWIADTKPADLYFGVVIGGSVALIDHEKVLTGLIGVTLIIIARFIQLKIDKAKGRSL